MGLFTLVLMDDVNSAADHVYLLTPISPLSEKQTPKWPIHKKKKKSLGEFVLNLARWGHFFFIFESVKHAIYMSYGKDGVVEAMC